MLEEYASSNNKNLFLICVPFSGFIGSNVGCLGSSGRSRPM